MILKLQIELHHEKVDDLINKKNNKIQNSLIIPFVDDVLQVLVYLCECLWDQRN